jgi:hypothetical protein
MRPSDVDVYNRLVILRYVVVHSVTTPLNVIPDLYRKWSEKERNEFESELEKRAQQTIDSLKQLKLWNLVSPWEKTFLQSYGSKMDQYARMAASWRMEAAGIMMWALNIIEEWPKIDEEISPELLKNVEVKRLGLFSKPFIMRSKKELNSKRNLIEFWHWRVRTRQLIERGDPFPTDETMKKAGWNSYDDVVRFSARAGKEKGDLADLIDDDFVFLGKAFRDLNAEEYQKATSIIMERHFAMNWLCGKAPGNRWDETPTDT